jgi:hypothetical protein
MKPWMGNTLPLQDVNSHTDGVYIDVMRGGLLSQPAPSDPAARTKWLEHHADHGFKADLCFDMSQDAFVAVRGAKVAILDAGSWWAADRVKLADLQKLIQNQGAASVPYSSLFAAPDPRFRRKILKADAPCLVVQTKEGGISVLRVDPVTMIVEMNNQVFPPTLNARPRPLAPNPPLYTGDETETSP